MNDFEIPKKYGLRQTIADTLGIGGIMRGLRSIPVLLDICREMERLCPHALHLNYVNPMAINCWAISQTSPIQTVGLCHSVQGTAGKREHIDHAAMLDPHTAAELDLDQIWRLVDELLEAHADYLPAIARRRCLTK